MQSQYDSPSLAAAPALECVGVGRRVVKLDGSAINGGTSIVRNLLRIVDHLPYAIPYLLIWSYPTKQCLGDCIAHTVVVRRCKGHNQADKGMDQTTTA